MIIIKPLGGLCNRIRAIASAFFLAKDLNKKLIIIWNKDRYLGCKFRDLFEPIDDVKVIETSSLFNLSRLSKINYTYFKYRVKAYKYIDDEIIRKNKYNIEIEKLNNDKVIFIETCYSFYQYTNLNLFKPIQEIKQSVDEITKFFDENIVGVHIRRGDNIKSIEKSKSSEFINAMNFEIEKCKDVKFFLATDSPLEEERLKKKYKNRIITNKKEFKRNSLMGMQDAVVDLLCLSETNKIFASYNSSFSDIAGELKGIEKIII